MKEKWAKGDESRYWFSRTDYIVLEGSSRMLALQAA